MRENAIAISLLPLVCCMGLRTAALVAGDVDANLLDPPSETEARRRTLDKRYILSYILISAIERYI